MDRAPESAQRSATPGTHAQVRLQDSPAWRAAKESFLTSGDAEVARATISAMVQRAVVGAYETALLSVKGPAIALVAPGIFGRGELFPYSEVEVLVLWDAEAPSPALKERLAEFARLLWELGLRLNHSARTPGEALEVREKGLDFTLALLDQRLLAGDAELHAKFAANMPPG
jgi:[protein-PII] uridylyltransferase